MASEGNEYPVADIRKMLTKMFNELKAKLKEDILK
jgi:hypothetical protein